MELGRINTKIVYGLTRSGNYVGRSKVYRYRGLVINLQNKRSLGFQQMASTSWNSRVAPTGNLFRTQIWSGTEIDPLNEGLPVKEWSIRTNDESKIFPTDLSENNNELLSFKSTTYQKDNLLNGQVVTTVPDSEKGNVVTALLPKTTRGKDFLTNTIAENTTNYGQYYLPSESISKINGSFAVTTSTYEYSNNSSGVGADYYVGRLISKNKSVQAYNDTQSEKEEYTYDNNLIKTIKKWNRDNTDYLLETYTYDGFGNENQLIASNSSDSQTETVTSIYENKGRFVERKIDNLNLETSFTYNDAGQILTQTDPLDNLQTNVYDAWGKLLSSDSNLEGTTTYTYNRDADSNTVITQSSPDGNVSKKYTNLWGQDYKVSSKAFGQGQFTSTVTFYDLLGRKIRESEPYFGEAQPPSDVQWNVIEYDDAFYPAKITTTALAKVNTQGTVTSFIGKQNSTTISGLTTTDKELGGYGRTTFKTTDALGNVVSSTDEGGYIQFSYNASGQQIQAKYDEISVATKYDSWGRKSEFNDPSNGLYKYEYDGFGHATKTISPKGKKEYIYNNLGQLISQTEFSTIDGGQTTNKTISYTYDDKGILTEKSGTNEGQTFSTNFMYDKAGRLLSSIENSNGRTYQQKEISYDKQNRIVSYEKELLSSGVITKVVIENVYSPWNGELYQIKDKTSGKLLWELKETNAKGLVLNSTLGAANIINSYDANGFLKTVNHSSTAKPGILQLTYTFDGVKNELLSRITGGDFSIQEFFKYDENNRLVNWTNPVTNVMPSADRNVYDKKGRILENDEVGIMQFENSAKIYQPTGMKLNSAGEQNYTNNLIQTVTYNENNDPVFIDGEKGDVAFHYGLTSMRQKVTYKGKFSNDGEGKYTKFYSEDGSFEVVKRDGGPEKHILYIGGSPYESDIVFLKNIEETNGTYKFLHKDYLGSVLAISDEAGNKLEQRHFDAWGNMTHFKKSSEDTVTNPDQLNSIVNGEMLIDRGYTSHEHFAEVGIIHMNGRLYDPLLRRFLNADENIQEPTNTQNYNKYGYVMNNPMMYNDPTGEVWGWLIGTIVGSYLSGVQANNGNFNPVKWDWKATSTWTSVIGGGISGAALGQGIQNATTSGAKYFQSSIIGAAGGIFNGLSTGQNIFKSALIGFTGISTTIDVFAGNKLTSTDSFTDRNRYIISPDYNEGNEGADYLSGPGPKHPFSRIEINQLVSAGIISAATAKTLLASVAVDGAGVGVASGVGTSAALGGTAFEVHARTFALGLLLSVRGDSSGPPKAYVYSIMGSEKIAKFGVTRAMDPDSRPERQIPLLNRAYKNEGPHNWIYIHQGVTSQEAFLYEKYYVWQYKQNTGEMPYAQQYPNAQALEKAIKKLLRK